MQNTIQKFRQSSIVFEKPGILSENVKTLTNSNYPTVQYFLFSTYQYLQKCVGGFFISFRYWVICKYLKRPASYTQVFYTFINNSRSKQNKKKSHTPFCRHY